MRLTACCIVVGLLSPPSFALQATDAVAKGRIRAQPFCHREGQEFVAQTIVDVEYRYSKDRAASLGREIDRSRVLWSITCSLETRQCDAVSIDLERLDRGEELHLWDLTKVKGMTVAAQSGNVITMVWPPYRTLILDLSTRRLEFRESGSAGEGRGSGVCNSLVAK